MALAFFEGVSYPSLLSCGLGVGVALDAADEGPMEVLGVGNGDARVGALSLTLDITDFRCSGVAIGSGVGADEGNLSLMVGFFGVGSIACVWAAI